MPIQILPGTPDYLELEIKGQLTHLDYQAVVPEIERLLAEVDAVNVLVHAEAFSGWDLHAAWDDIKLGFKYRHVFKRVAWLGDKAWPDFLSHLSKYFFGCTIRQFSQKDISAAKSWLRG